MGVGGPHRQMWQISDDLLSRFVTELRYSPPSQTAILLHKITVNLFFWPKESLLN